MKKVALIICLAALLVSFSSIDKASAQKPIELTYSVFYPTANKQAMVAAEWAREIEKRTNGRVKITVFSGGTLTPADKCYQGVISGISDIGLSAFGYTMGRFPMMYVFELPLGIRSGMLATKLVNEFYKKFQPKEADDTKIMYLHATSPGTLHTKKPVQNLEDLKGMKIRTAGLMTRIAALLGAAPIAMPMGEAYDGLSKGVIEGILTDYYPLEGYRLAEVVKYTTECQSSIGYVGVQFITMNKDRWNALPPDIQKIIKEVNEEWIGKTGKVWEETNKSGKEFTLKSGNKIISLSKEEGERWAKAVEPLIDEYVNEMKTKGLPGEEALKFCMEYLKKNQ